MVSPKLTELEDAIESLSLNETIWVLEKVIGKVKKLTQGVNNSDNLAEFNGVLSHKIETDHLIGLFEAEADLATNSETILQQEINEVSGWSWKGLLLG